MSRRQLLAAGVSDKEIRLRLALRRIQRVHDGVYGLPRIGERGRWLAAAMAGGAGAVLSHRSAAALWDLRPYNGRVIDVTVPRPGGGGRAGIRLHRTRSLPPAEVTAIDGIPCTTVARTVVDLAAELRPRDVKRLLERAQQLRLFDLKAFSAVLAGANGRRGTGTVRRLVAELSDDPPPTRSELERRFLELVDAAGLPRPVVNGIVCGYEVDFHWPHARLVVETDGAETHATQVAFHRDRERDLALELAGWHVVRITWRQLRDQPDRIVAVLRANLGRL